MAIYGAANGMTEIDMFSAAYAGVACVYGTPNNGNDCITCGAYAESVATALGSSSTPAQRSPLFYVLQNLLRWFPLITPGVPLPI
jgi:translation initiation factor 6 (eIF-6)